MENHAHCQQAFSSFPSSCHPTPTHSGLGRYVLSTAGASSLGSLVHSCHYHPHPHFAVTTETCHTLLITSRVPYTLEEVDPVLSYLILLAPPTYQKGPDTPAIRLPGRREFYLATLLGHAQLQASVAQDRESSAIHPLSSQGILSFVHSPL